MPAWTQEEEMTAQLMARDGATARQIGAELGRSKNSVIGHFYRYKLEFPQRTLKGFQRAPDLPAAKITAIKAEAQVRLSQNMQALPEEPRPVRTKRIPFDPTKAKPAGKPAPFYLATGCRYILADKATYDAETCNAPRVPGLQWCEAHLRRVCNIPELKRQTQKLEAAE